MAEPLNRLISSTQTIGGAASISGTPTPITPVGAAGIGANQQAAKMAGTPAQKDAALVRNLRETRSEVDQAAFQASAAPKKSKTVEDLMRAQGIVDKVGNLANRVGQEKIKAVADAAVATEFPTKQYLTPARMQAVFPGLPEGQADDVSSALAVFMDGVDLSKDDPRLVSAARTLTNAKKADGSPLFPPEVLQNPDALRKLTLPPEAINMTPSELADQLLSKVKPDIQLSTLSSPAFLEAVGGPGYTEQQWQQLIADVGGKPSMKWGDFQTAVKAWQTSTMTDYNALQTQAASSNENVAQEAQQRLRELGFFGGQSYADKVANLDIDKADDIAIPGMDATLDDVLSGSAKGKQALVDVLVRAEKDPTYWDSLPKNLADALKAAAGRAKTIGQISADEVAGIAATTQGDAATRKGYTQYTKEDGTPQDFTPSQLQALEAMGIRFDPANPVPASMVSNPFFRMLASNAFGAQTSKVVGLLDEATRSPQLMEFLRTAGEQKIRNSRMMVDPAGFKADLIKATTDQTTLTQAKAGNQTARAELVKSLNLGASEKDVAARLKEMVDAGVTSVGGVAITKTVPGKRYQVPVRDLFGRTKLEWRQDPSTTVSLSPMELAEALTKGSTPDRVIAGQRNPLDLFKEGIVAATNKVAEKKARETNIKNTVETVFKSNAGVGKRLGDSARSLAASLPKNRGLMDQLATIIENGPTSDIGWKNRHSAHKESIRLMEQVIPQLERELATVRNDRGIRDYGNDPAVRAEMQALERSIADAKKMANFIADVTTGRVTKQSKLPDWFKKAPQTATVSV